MKRWLFFLLAFSSLLFCEEEGGLVPKLPPSQESPAPKEKSLDEMQHSYQAAFVKTSIVLILILALVFVCFWLYKRLMRTRIRAANNLRNIKVIERRPISPKTILYLIEVGKEQILIGESQLEVRTLKQFDWEGHCDPDILEKTSTESADSPV